MSGSLRKLKRQRDKDSVELSPSEQKLPTGRIATRVSEQPPRGRYLAFPLLGWISARHRDRIPLVMLALALLRPEEGDGIIATLEVEFPLYVDTEAATLAALDRLGWTGTSWSPGEPSPFGDESVSENLAGLISQAALNLKATLLFAPSPDAPPYEVEVLRAAGKFLMPPLEPPSEPPTAERLKLLRDLVLDYRRFFVAEESLT